jgi:hypothetical protein
LLPEVEKQRAEHRHRDALLRIYRPAGGLVGAEEQSMKKEAQQRPLLEREGKGDTGYNPVQGEYCRLEHQDFRKLYSSPEGETWKMR